MGRNKQLPKRAATADPRKAIPAAAGRAAAVLLPHVGKLTVRWTKFDYEGPFCLSRSSIDTVVQMLKQAANMESMTVLEVFRGDTGKDYGDPERLPNSDAVTRIRELGFNDETNISTLRFSGRQRLYGFRRDNDFYAIFWDPEHEIWPTKLKHT